MEIISLQNQLAGKQPVYTAMSAPFTVAAAATDVFVMEGIAGKTIYIWRAFLSTIQTTAGVNTWFWNKHSTANAGGTAVASTIVPHDSSFAASTALVQHYTANGTPGTSIGTVMTSRLNSPAAATAGIGNHQGIWFDFTYPIVLKGTAQGLALNFGGATVVGLSAVAGYCWTEL